MPRRSSLTLNAYARELAAFRADYAAAGQALRAAVARHGIEGLSLYPPAAPIQGEIQVQERSVLGVRVQETRWPDAEGAGLASHSRPRTRARRAMPAARPSAA